MPQPAGPISPIGALRPSLASGLVPIYLVRHAHAGSRSAWEGDDRERPLSSRGRGQAAWLTERLGGEKVRRIVTSPHRRCVETVEPLAAALDREVVVDERLAEGADPQDAAEWLVSLSPKTVVACSHGDLIPKVLRYLAAGDLELEDPLLDAKGSIWVLDGDDARGRPTHGRYVAPPKA